MKIWLKFGIGLNLIMFFLSVLVYLILFLFGANSLINGFIIFGLPSMFFALLFMKEGLFTSNFVFFGVSILSWFVIGVLIGLIIQKIKRSKRK
ncbi:MAG: hypothetical protein WCX73_01095 [Candidatus Pacearchaeota archaeon]|jgi:hypothetical protein